MGGHSLSLAALDSSLREGAFWVTSFPREAAFWNRRASRPGNADICPMIDGADV